jgi:transcriptional regulator with XRE-family HTH domain
VQAWESGKSQPRLRYIPKLAEELGVPAEQLLDVLEGKVAA